ncbi:acyl carrier protein [Streptomyces sp. E-15]|uniref:acyl carrier protein n=1 Tax=Streptomyces sp. NRRL S-31 TaxID=1463898 RepID=UPI0004C92633|nr:acyl carrier protein [Streptomyces sp. NRRL S-31]
MSSGTRDIRTWLTERVATYLRRAPEEIDTAVPMSEYGLDSLTALAVSADIEDEFGLVLPPETTWDHPTIDQLGAALTALIEEKA